MKRKMITAMIFSALLAASMTGCGASSSDSSNATSSAKVTTTLTVSTEETQPTTAAEVSTSITTAAATTTEAITTATQTTAATSDASAVLDEEQMKEISKKLIQEYVSLYDGMVCGWVQTDENDVYNADSTRPYYHVTDSKYQSIADLKAALANTLSGSEYDKMTNLMLEEDCPIYIEQEGKLYALSVGRGAAYSDTWHWDELQFTKVTDDSFTVTGKYDHMVDTVIAQSFDIVNTEDGFRICNVSASQIL